MSYAARDLYESILGIFDEAQRCWGDGPRLTAMFSNAAARFRAAQTERTKQRAQKPGRADERKAARAAEWARIKGDPARLRAEYDKRKAWRDRSRAKRAA